MITFKQLNWNNFFSYGANNSIQLSENPVIQLTGNNGAGKTSIPLILQEIVYGKNVRKSTKAKLVNRYTDAKEISAELEFAVNEDNYTLSMSRKGAKVTVVLIENGYDISEHKVPDTIKLLENILNLNFETFCQLVYQSSKSSLEFLTATDTQRKKFLVNLFGLNRYAEIHKELTQHQSETKIKLAKAEGKKSALDSRLEELSSISLEPLEKETVPNIDINITHEGKKLKDQLKDIVELNKKIIKNNKVRSELFKCRKFVLVDGIVEPPLELRTTATELKTLIFEKKKVLTKINSLSPLCPSCKREIDISDQVKLGVEINEELEILIEKAEDTNTRLKTQETKYNEFKEAKDNKDLVNRLTQEWDQDLPGTVLVAEDIELEIQKLTEKYKKQQALHKAATENNIAVDKHNIKIQLTIDELDKLSKEIEEVTNLVEIERDKLISLDILVKAFSTNGLVSYKLDYLTKDLEIVINEYLQELSKGQFQLSFALKGEKLNIEIDDGGSKIDIPELSEGELSKVNVATLLAIRKLMQSLSNTKLNILFLDEIMGVLDAEGREDLIQVLLKEDNLNTFLVTHEYTHPLVPVISVIKDNKISRLEL